MRQTDALYQAYLEEMQAIENFRMTYSSAHPEAALEKDDPEVRRLIEAMAFFTARTRLSALNNLLKTRRRLFQQFFSYLLSPLPAVGLLQAVPTGRFAEPAVLPKGAEIVVAPEGGQAAIFRTMAEVRILPVRLEGVDMLLLPKEGFRIVLDFRAAYPRNDDIGLLPVYITHLNNYNASLQVFWNLRRHLQRALVVFDERPTEISEGPPVEVTFGALAEGDATPHPAHPVQDVRAHLHFPERELFASFQVPPPPRNWQRFCICLDVAAQWPKSLRLNKDIFQLYTVPIVNLRRAMAEPILCDGRTERCVVRFPDPRQRMALHSIMGVYQLDEKGGMTPLRPGLISGGTGSYEVEREDAPGGGPEIAYLKIELPEAFEKPRKVAVDALWYQPWFSEVASIARLTPTLYDRTIAGVNWELIGDIRPHADNPLRNDMEALLQVLALKNKAMLNLDDLRVVLNALGSLKNSVFRQVPDWIVELQVTVVPAARDEGGVRHLYELKLRDFDPSYRPLVEVLLRQLARLLNAWVPDATVAIEATLAGSGERIAFE